MFITVFSIDFIYGTCILMKETQGTKKKSIQPSSHMFTVCCKQWIFTLPTCGSSFMDVTKA